MNRIVVEVTPEYLPGQSEPDNNKFTFAYHIAIRNLGDTPAQLISRHWVITDGNAKIKEVQGPGVVGEKPLIAPGQSFRYSSGVVLDTEVGTMEGSYQMVSDQGETFDAKIPAFLLSVPGRVH